MQSGETILTLGSLALLTLFSVSINQQMSKNRSAMYQSAEVVEAIGLAQRVIEQAEMLEFDEDATATIPSSFTSGYNLGAENGEYYINDSFDDIDDYNGFTNTAYIMQQIPCNISVDVSYATPDNITSSSTYFKKMTVSVTSPGFAETVPQPIVLTRTFAYHYFFNE